nr:MAG TPA: hypothetical protein [Microviridae sp.]
MAINNNLGAKVKPLRLFLSFYFIKISVTFRSPRAVFSLL